MQSNASRVGEMFIKSMMKLRDEFEVVGDVRGKGLMLGMELVTDKVVLPLWQLNNSRYTHIIYVEVFKVDGNVTSFHSDPKLSF